MEDGELQVDCYCGYRGDQEPRRFRLAGRLVEVVEIIDRWNGPDHRFFKLRGNDGVVYLLRHDETKRQWTLAPAARQSTSEE